ncbi:hypothetical protein [Brevibacillus choshinensis]|uniref:hypothetical protein n=1 Tax=Brevibacillus choshinensis TaxID=54911 RepID=UPI002E1E7A16|nr:hypothetical protein [Brevibacillus choshinensis]MED4754799.1 hypothetical protein [Brevibacillus choshinensis]
MEFIDWWIFVICAELIAIAFSLYRNYTRVVTIIKLLLAATLVVGPVLLFKELMIDLIVSS